MSLLIRPADWPAERKFISDSWIKSFRLAWEAGCLPLNIQHEAYQQFIDWLVARPHVRIAVACSSEAPSVIASWIAWEPPGHHQHMDSEEGKVFYCTAPVLLYVFTREEQRRQGHARALLAHAKINPRLRFCYAFQSRTMFKRVKGERLEARVLSDGTELPERFIPPCWPGGRFQPLTYRFTEKEHTK